MIQTAWSRLGLARFVALTLGVALALALSGRASAQDSPALLIGLQRDADEGTVAAALERSGGWVALGIPELHLLVVKPGNRGEARVVRAVERLPAVRYVERDRQLTLADARVNDPMYVSGKQWNLHKMRVADAWELLPAGAKTIVAVIDSGIDARHPDLSGQVLSLGCDMQLQSGCQGASGVPPIDMSGHGTHVAGIIGAATNNGLGVASVGGQRVSILAVRVAFNASRAVDGARALQALVYAINNGAKVINMSFGGPCGTPQSDPWLDAVSYAENRDVLLVVSAGNDGACPQGRYPAHDPRVLSVAATAEDGYQPNWSARGDWVSVAAPGAAITSTYPNGGYATLSGTSMAAPHVAALAALLYQAPGATKAKVMEWIKGTCDGAERGNLCGGVVNAYRAVHLAVKGVDPKLAPADAAPPAGENE